MSIPERGEGQSGPKHHQHVGGYGVGHQRQVGRSGENDARPASGARPAQRTSGEPDRACREDHGDDQIGAHAPGILAQQAQAGNDGYIGERGLGPMRAVIQDGVVVVPGKHGFAGGFRIAAFRGFIQSAAALERRCANESEGEHQHKTPDVPCAPGRKGSNHCGGGSHDFGSGERTATGRGSVRTRRWFRGGLARSRSGP